MAYVSVVTGGAIAADFDANQAQGPYIEAFDSRKREQVTSFLTASAVFPRAYGEDAFLGLEEVVDPFAATIAASTQWNVKFARRESAVKFPGRDWCGVERDQSAMTAGADERSCLAGSLRITWRPQDSGLWA